MNKAQKINSNSQSIAQNRRKYDVIDYQTRKNLIRLVIQDGSSVADACRKYKVKMTTGCLIVRNYRSGQRIFQKPGKGGPNNSILQPQPQKNNRRDHQRKRHKQIIKKIEPTLVQTDKTIPPLEPQIKVENLQNTEIRYMESLPAVSLATTQTPLFLPPCLQLSYQLYYIPNWSIIWQ